MQHRSPIVINPLIAIEPRPPAGVFVGGRHPLTAEWYCLVTTIGRGGVLDFKSLPGLDNDAEEQYAAYTGGLPLFEDFTSNTSISALQELYPLPDPDGGPCTRYMRWTAFSSYNKLFAAILLLNLSCQIIFLSELRHRPNHTATYGSAASIASGNLCVSILMRNEHVINILFLSVCAVPHNVPLLFRRRLAKVYNYGGLHSACGVAGTLWYLIFFGLYTYSSPSTTITDVLMSITTGLLTGLLIAIIVFAQPQMRSRYHDYFETTHRFLGWAAILCFWIQLVLLVRGQSSELHSWHSVLSSTPTFWFLLVISVCILYPWSRLRLRKVQAERLSMEAIRLRFNYRSMDTCFGIRLTDTPLMETHSFATIPDSGGKKGFSVLISAAGDWTRNIIRNPPTHIWIKGGPVIGVARIALMFRKVLLVATGTGIGPCLSFLQAKPRYPSRVLWSARRPAQTYDSETFDSVLRADPNAVILDSSTGGRCDLLALAYSLVRESKSEAVIVISNPKVVSNVVGGLETRGIPAYGPIFDS